MIYIDKNESPVTPLDEKTMTSIISATPYNLYPDAAYEQFKEAYAKFYGLSPEQIIAGNGSDELIQKLMLIMPKGPALTLNPDFFMYQAYAAQVNREIAFVDAGADLTFDLETILTKIDEVQPSFFIMSNPHNPSGKQFDTAFLTAIADKMKSLNGYFVIDEAYLDYGMAYDVEMAPHILRMRTLSKAFGIAGLRLGVLISTAETQLNISISDDQSPSHINTGVGFLNHMLTLFTFHSGLSLNIEAQGDIDVDDHHVTEDIGIVIGQLLLEMIKDKKHFVRYGTMYIPMDETLARVVVDISGRPYLSFNASLSKEKVGTFDTELVEEFFRAVVINARLTTHIDLIRGGNTHHEIEAIFKAFSRALGIALTATDDQRVPSSKGVIE